MNVLIPVLYVLTGAVIPSAWLFGLVFITSRREASRGRAASRKQTPSATI